MLLRALEGAGADQGEDQDDQQEDRDDDQRRCPRGDDERERDLDRVEDPSQQVQGEDRGDQEEGDALAALGCEGTQLRLVELDLAADDAGKLSGDGREEGADAGARLAGGACGLCGGRVLARAEGWAESWMLLRVRVNEARPRLIRLVSHEE